MADMLSSVALCIVPTNHSAFINDICIMDPIILTSECINLLNINCKGGITAIKLDISKVS